jgi:hypothetical protein
MYIWFTVVLVSVKNALLGEKKIVRRNRLENVRAACLATTNVRVHAIIGGTFQNNPDTASDGSLKSFSSLSTLPGFLLTGT